MALGYVGFSGVLAAEAPKADAGGQYPGKTYRVLASELPKPFATPAANNNSNVIARPQGALPGVPAGFHVSVYAEGFSNARWMAVAPNGDVFLAEPTADKVTLLRDTNGDGVADQRFTFADGFEHPHGLALHDGALYVGDLRAAWRMPYKDGDTKASAAPKNVTEIGAFGPAAGGHLSRNIAFDSKGRMYVSIGSRGNINEEGPPHASVQMWEAGKQSTFASGLRNPVGIAFYPGTDDLYTVVNERDGLGDGLVPDYLTRVDAGAFYGWPYAYLGNHLEPRLAGKHDELAAKTKAPDLLFEAHSAALGLLFYTGTQFPERYRTGAFVSLHGSWNSGKPTGYKLVYVPFNNKRPGDSYEDFATGFWSKTSGGTADVWGRPVGLAMAKDGSLLVADDVANVIWKISYTRK